MPSRPPPPPLLIKKSGRGGARASGRGPSPTAARATDGRLPFSPLFFTSASSMSPIQPAIDRPAHLIPPRTARLESLDTHGCPRGLKYRISTHTSQKSGRAEPVYRPSIHPGSLSRSTARAVRVRSPRAPVTPPVSPHRRGKYASVRWLRASRRAGQAKQQARRCKRARGIENSRRRGPSRHARRRGPGGVRARRQNGPRLEGRAGVCARGLARHRAHARAPVQPIPANAPRQGHRQGPRAPSHPVLCRLERRGRRGQAQAGRPRRPPPLCLLRRAPRVAGRGQGAGGRGPRRGVARCIPDVRDFCGRGARGAWPGTTEPPAQRAITQRRPRFSTPLD